MHRVDLYAADGGLGLVVTGRDIPHLRLEVASGRRMLLRQQNRVVLLGKVHRWNYGVHVYRTGDYVSPLHPLRADHTRQVTPPRSGAWFDRWAHQFASWLGNADAGPLHNGFWILRPRRLPPYCLRDDLTEDYPAAYLDWLGEGWNGVLPLRQLPEADAGRVRAYRRQARERVLPPILLWSVSGLDGYLLLDGHCRLAAALAEGVEPSVLVLAIGSDPETDHEWLDQAATGHVGTDGSSERAGCAGTPRRVAGRRCPHTSVRGQVRRSAPRGKDPGMAPPRRRPGLGTAGRNRGTRLVGGRGGVAPVIARSAADVRT